MPAPAPHPLRDRWRRAGVRVRSTLAATALLAVLVVAGGVVGLAALRGSLYGAAEASSAVQARLVRLSVSADVLDSGLEGPGSAQRSALEAAVGADDDRGSHVQVLDADGRVVARSAALAGLDAISGARPAVGELLQEEREVPALGGRWVVTVVGARVDDRDFRVVAAESTAEEDAALRQAALVLAVGAPLLLAAIAAATWTFTGRSLRPVEAIRRTVEGITSAGLDGRVPVPEGRDEVARLAVTMNEMLSRLESSQRSQRRFVADASHELRSPVATLRAAAEVWSADAGAPREFTELVRSEAGRVEALVADLLLLARADEGRLAREDADVDLDEVLEGEAARLRALGAVRVRARTVPVRVRGDHRQLSRLVRNLTDNAARHAAGTVELRTALEGGSALLEVADDGPGVPEAERERVFERFVRLDASRDRASGGTGLGLAIVAEIAAAHGGSVRALPRPGGGALVRLVLPLGAPADGTDAADPADGRGPGGVQPPSAASR
ncbi:HAMP domain-containing protein [Kineococcus sp. T13]|uniref:ATP-binding protein n=1 Tax=Kineococcus vitellinus TaxID=2696565 RepID=UPI0014135F6F|nr:HAMP domain-containing protein [Kineococcus vitellinus]